MTQLRLLTIPISHYCEKARWALDRLAIPYVEERHLQVFHYPRSYWLSRGPNVPVLIDGNTTITDSTTILQYLDRYATEETHLYPATVLNEIDTLEELFDETLGIESRRWVYFHALQTPSMALRISSQGVPNWQASIAPLCYPLLKAFIRRKLDVSAKTVDIGLERSRSVIAQVDTLLSDGRPYLLGNRFTAADLTLAAMMAPFLMPVEYGVRLPQLDEISSAMRSTVEEMRSTRAGQHSLLMYQTQRLSATTCESALNTQVTSRSSPSQAASV